MLVGYRMSFYKQVQTRIGSITKLGGRIEIPLGCENPQDEFCNDLGLADPCMVLHQLNHGQFCLCVRADGTGSVEWDLRKSILRDGK